MLNKSAWICLSFLLNTALSAASLSLPTHSVCHPEAVVVPCNTIGWTIGVEGLYLQAVHQGYPDSFTTANLSNGLSPNTGWNGGYRLEGIYRGNLAQDFGISYLHFDATRNRNNYAGQINPSLPSFPVQWRLANRFDQINITTGRSLELGKGKDARLFAGLQYARIRMDADNLYLTPLPFAGVGFSRFETRREMDYNGVGPVLGVNTQYDLPSNLYLAATGTGAILVGQSRQNSGLVLRPASLVASSFFSSQRTLVPSLEAKLGLGYACDTYQGSMRLEGGYQVIHYFNLPQMRWPLETFSVSNHTMFSLHGPYLGLKWLGNV